MRAAGRVASWRREEGWGVLESDQTPDGCWAHFSAIRMAGFRELHPGQQVDFDWEHAAQDGYRFRATSIRPHDQITTRPTAPDSSGTAAYQSGLDITWDQQPDP